MHHPARGGLRFSSSLVSFEVDHGDRMSTTMVTTSVLTLGDGDFSFSLDLTKCLPKDQYSIVATVFDSPEELHSKYKDASSILRRMNADVRFEVDAVDPSTFSGSADRVIFNHPHLGTEDAARHARFLGHLFYTVDRQWLNPHGLFYMTLAHGQFERWNCLAMAQRHGFRLLHRAPFQPPKVDEPSYTLRRHQTGKSFAARRSASETLVFVRINDRDPGTEDIRLWWEEEVPGQSDDGPVHECPDCGKVFAEKRSWRNHRLSAHSKKANPVVCGVCQKVFQSQDAMEAHQVAKHRGRAPKPDWFAVPSEGKGLAQGFQCTICGFDSPSAKALSDHQTLEFLPQSTHTTVDCLWCGKTFRERRAQVQHEAHCRITRD